MIRRPKPGDGEEEILQMQEEFLRAKAANRGIKPAAKVVDLRHEAATSSSVYKPFDKSRKPSKYAQAKGLTGCIDKKPKTDISCTVGDIREKNMEIDNPEIEDKLRKPSKYPQAKGITSHIHKKLKNDNIPCTVGDIREKNIDIDDPEIDKVNFPQLIPNWSGSVVEKNKIVTSIAYNPVPTAMGFPEAKYRTDKEFISCDLYDTVLRNNKNTSESTTDKSFIVSFDADSIHRENIELMRKMSDKEILEEQKKLKETLDPQVLQFLLKRRKITEQDTNLARSEESSHDTTTLSDIKSVETVDHMNIDDSLWENDILSHEDVTKWLHFDTLEKDKVEWMKGIRESCDQKPNEPHEARFDFKGYLLPYSLEYNEETKPLFHHGGEPHRPGYSLLELFELSRSSVLQQRIISLNIIAGILEYYSMGVYKNVIELPITKIFFVIRFALDENIVGVIEPALCALRNLFFNRLDEACLDALLCTPEGYEVPYLEHDKSEIVELESHESEIKDFHLADIDLLAGALRTDILQRLYYILDVVKPSFKCVAYCLQILIRFARNSAESALNIVKCDHLMFCIMKNFVPATGINCHFNKVIVYNGKPVLVAVKFIRVLCLQSYEVCKILTDKFKITEPLSNYIDCRVDDTYGLKIQMEAITALTNLLIHKVAIDRILPLGPILLSTLSTHTALTDIYSRTIATVQAGIIIQFFSKVLLINKVNCDSKIKSQIYHVIKDGLLKWTSQIMNSNSPCVNLRLLCSTFDCLITLTEIEGPSIIDDRTIAIFKTFARSKEFKLLVEQLIPSSNFLSNIDSSNFQITKNLISLDSCVIDSKDKVLPVLRLSSPILFFTSYLKLVYYISDSFLHSIHSEYFLNYISEISRKKPSLCENWFSRVEANFLFHLLKYMTSSFDTEQNIVFKDKDCVYSAANKMCYILRSDKNLELDFLFHNIIFNDNWFASERFLNMLSFSDSLKFFSINSIINIRSLYSNNIINVCSKKSTPDKIVKNWRDPILPRDWIYLPIVKLYSGQQVCQDAQLIQHSSAYPKNSAKDSEQQFIVNCCLEWILFSEVFFSDLLEDIHITDKFCRIMCVYLCDNSLFLNENTKLLLEKNIETIFKKEKINSFDFDREMVGVSNFQDFYTQFLEQFQAVSYGDHNFAACVLAPLAQKHNVKWRKLLWSEYAGCLTALDCPLNRLCHDINEYLYPIETDESLLKCYLHALSTNLLRKNTIPFRIAAHHVSNFRRANMLPGIFE